METTIPISYTITAYDDDFRTHVSYRGLVQSIRDDQSIRRIFFDSECLIINPPIATKLCDRGNGAIHLEVALHVG